MGVFSAFNHDEGRPSIEDIERIAKDILARYGEAARTLVEERVVALERSALWGEHAAALRVLTSIEQLSAGCTAPE